MYIQKKKYQINVSALKNSLSTCCLCVFMLLILGTENRVNEVRMVPEEQDVRWDPCSWH